MIVEEKTIILSFLLEVGVWNFGTVLVYCSMYALVVDDGESGFASTYRLWRIELIS
jgi:hypothetical protein